MRLFVSHVCMMVSIALFSNGAIAQRTGQVTGAGTTSCVEYGEARTQGGVGISYQYVNWIYGYVSAYNIYSSYPTVVAPEFEPLQTYLDKYCKNNPQGTIVSAGARLIGDLGGFKPN